MSTQKQKIKLDIKQGFSPLLILFLNRKNGILEMHVEDIAIEVKEKFPTFFSWSKYKERIDLRQVMRTLDKLKDDGLINGSNTTMWGLNKDGYKLSKEIFENYEISNSVKIKRASSDFYAREINRLTTSKAFYEYSSNNINTIKDNDLRYLFRIDNYNKNKKSLNRNIDRLYIASNTNKDLTSFLDRMIKLLIERKIINKGDLND